MVGREATAAREALLMRGVLDMCVLALLDEHPLHAYGIVQRLQEHGFTSVSYGTVYPLVTRLRKQRLLDQRLEASPSGPGRNVLTLNDAGREALAQWSRQWRDTTEVTMRILSGVPEDRRA